MISQNELFYVNPGSNSGNLFLKIKQVVQE